jgi:hypothetical protein
MNLHKAGERQTSSQTILPLSQRPAEEFVSAGGLPGGIPAASVLSRLTLDNRPRPFGGEGGDPSADGEPGEGVARDYHCRELCGIPH